MVFSCFLLYFRDVSYLQVGEIADIADLEAPAKRGTALTDGAARAEPNIFELSRVVTEVDDKSMQGVVNGLADIAEIAEMFW